MTRFLASTPAFPVADLDAAAAFYAEACGYERVVRGDDFAVLARDGQTLMLWLAGDERWRGREAGAPPASPVQSGAESFLSGTASCRIQVEGIDALHARLQSLGAVHPNGPLKRVDWGAREFAILD
ncbi:MAG: VOC family protein, partial [Pseudomonadota bacterium]